MYINQISVYMMVLTVLLLCLFIFGSVCGCSECFCLRGNMLYKYVGRSSRPFVVDVYVKSVC
jgi:hypothetical protein